jgi:hypothetical protein
MVHCSRHWYIDSPLPLAVGVIDVVAGSRLKFDSRGRVYWRRLERLRREGGARAEESRDYDVCWLTPGAQ